MNSTEHENYQTLISRWMTGANCGNYGPLYISSRGFGTSLFLARKRKGRQNDLRLAIMKGREIKLLTMADPLNLRKTAEAFGVKIMELSADDYKSDGTIKPHVVKVQDN